MASIPHPITDQRNWCPATFTSANSTNLIPLESLSLGPLFALTDALPVIVITFSRADLL